MLLSVLHNEVELHLWTLDSLSLHGVSLLSLLLVGQDESVWVVHGFRWLEGWLQCAPFDHLRTEGVSLLDFFLVVIDDLVLHLDLGVQSIGIDLEERGASDDELMLADSSDMILVMCDSLCLDKGSLAVWNLEAVASLPLCVSIRSLEVLSSFSL